MDKMLQDISVKGQGILRPWKWITIGAGCNIMYKTNFVHPLKLLNLFLLIVAVMGCLAQFHFFWYHLHEPFEVYIEAILIFFQIAVSICKLWVFTFSQQRLFKVVQTVQNSEILKGLEIFELNLVDRSKIIKDILEILNASWYFIKFQLMVLVMNVVAIGGWYIGQSLAVNIYHIQFNHQEFQLKFPFPASFPKWHDKAPYLYAIEYMIVCMEVYFTAVCAVGFTGLFPVISVHCVALLKILRTLISYSTSHHVFPKDRVRYLQACIKLHQRIHEFCNELNSLYRMPTLAVFMVSCLVLCLLSFQASLDMGKDMSTIIKAFLYISAVFFEVGLFCCNGQRITSESERLSLEIYDCEWFEENDQFKFMTLIMILRSNQRITMDVGGFATMSLVTFLMIFRSSASYFLFLRECM